VPSYRVELHSHCQGDPVDSYLTHTLFQHIDQAKAVGLHAIAVTWHQKICAVPEAIAYARERGVLLIPGMEADVERRHLVVLNLAEGDLPSQPTWNEIRALRLRKPDVLVMAPHPYYPHPSCLGKIMDEHADCIDAVEWCILHVGFLPHRINPNLRAAQWARKYGKTLIATSDAHSLSTIGKNASTVEADELSLPAIVGGIRAGRVTFHRKSLALAPLVIQSGKAMASQPRHIARWIKAKLQKRRGYSATSSSSTGFEALP
jgi:predicted metal-dependent phosphoesterase TrpH